MRPSGARGPPLLPGGIGSNRCATTAHTVAQKTHLSLRLRPATLDRLSGRASRVGELKTSLAARYVEEGLRMEEHPGIVFRTGPAGRRAGLAGHRLDVWQVTETVRNE